jgi:hypothetical protein
MNLWAFLFCPILYWIARPTARMICGTRIKPRLDWRRREVSETGRVTRTLVYFLIPTVSGGGFY